MHLQSPEEERQIRVKGRVGADIEVGLNPIGERRRCEEDNHRPGLTLAR